MIDNNTNLKQKMEYEELKNAQIKIKRNQTTCTAKLLNVGRFQLNKLAIKQRKRMLNVRV